MYRNRGGRCTFTWTESMDRSRSLWTNRTFVFLYLNLKQLFALDSIACSFPLKIHSNGDDRRAFFVVESMDRSRLPYTNRGYVCIAVIDFETVDLAQGHTLTSILCPNNLRWRWSVIVESISLPLDDQLVSFIQVQFSVKA